MKSVVADYQTRVTCVRIVASDGTTLRFAAYPHPLIMSNAAVYESDSGYEFTGYKSNSGLSPSVLDMGGVLDVAGVSRQGLLSGVWDNAKIYLFHTSWALPIEDEEPEAKCLLGKVTLQDDTYVAELMHLIDALNQNVGRSVGPKCPWTLFDETLDGTLPPAARSRCTGPRSAPDGPAMATYKVTGTVTGVTSQTVWQDSARAEAAAYFDRGSVIWLTGSNAGLRSQEIKTHAAGGTVTQYLATHYPVQIGDTYDMVPGCDRRRGDKGAGDCKNKFSNAINFGGFGDVVTNSTYTDIGTGL